MIADVEAGVGRSRSGLESIERRHSSASFADLQQVHMDEKAVPLGLEWRDIHFGIGDKEILKGISGLIEPGHVTGVLGASGSGKTTLLNVLSGRQRTVGRERTSGSRQRISMTGEISICGRPVEPAGLRDKVAYVFQDIALLETETPRECLSFSARLRLPRNISKKEQQSYVDGMLSLLHLEHCADVCVGSALKKGLSGGEQKRVAIGVELISNPKIMFLDEPLSGLDSYNAFTLVRSLKRLAASGVPVLMTLHQPSSEIFAELEDTLVMHAGEVCYHGPAAGVAGHFEGCGFRCPANFNPSDFVMFTMARAGLERLQDLKDAWRKSDLHRDVLDQISTKGAHGEPCVSESTSEDSSSSDEFKKDRCTKEADSKASPRSFCEVLGALVRRDFRLVFRQRDVHIAGFITSLLVAFVYGWFFFDNGRKEDSEAFAPNCRRDAFDAGSCTAYFSAHFAVASLIAMNMMLVSLQIAIEIVHKERSVFLRERAAGYYGVIPYFLSKSCFETITGSTMAMLTLLGTYWLVGLRGSFFILFLEIELMALSSSSLMYCMSAAASSKDQAASLALLPQVLQFAFSGILVPTNMIPHSLRWLRWGCPLYYGIGMVSATEFDYVFKAVRRCKAEFGTNWAEECPGTKLQFDGLQWHDTHEDAFWLNLGMCVVLLVVFRCLAVAILARKSRFAV